MPCTTLLVGKKASYDGSTIIARTDDGYFDEKKVVVINPKQQPKIYKSKIGHLTIELPDNPLRYTCCPSVKKENGVWGAAGINSLNVGMTATETITSNALVVGADPYVTYDKSKKKVGGIGEEDLVSIVLPYIKSAKEGVIRLGQLLEKYGTYEANGIAFNDENEIWWLETIGGHHWMARKVPDDVYVVMPNQFGMDYFDFDDAYGKQEEFMCSKDLKEFMEKNHININPEDTLDFNPRLAFGSHSHADHVYNTPRAWYMARFFNPTLYKWDGPDAEFTPESDNIPWSLTPERKITIEDVKSILSSNYQGTLFCPYNKAETPQKGIYRSIGINRTSDTLILQIRNYVPEGIKAIEWICLGSTTYDVASPIYPNVSSLPKYYTNTKMNVSTDSFYWNARLIAALADPYYGNCVQIIERYQTAVFYKAQELLNEYDEKYKQNSNENILIEANDKIAEMVAKETSEALGKVLMEASIHMKNGYNRADN